MGHISHTLGRQLTAISERTQMASSGTVGDTDRRGGTSVHISEVGYAYGSASAGIVQAIDTVSLEVSAGEFVCILGMSGCGKSTLLKLVAGLALPTSGSITVAGELVRGPGHERGMVFQDYALLPWLTVRGNIELGPKLQGRSRSRRRDIADYYMHLVGLESFQDSYPYALSGGMRQRVAVARALAGEPSVILMDEPFGALDAQTRQLLQRELVRIWAETKKTILFVTHSVAEAAFLADRVVVMSPRPAVVREVVAVTTSRGARAEEVAGPEHNAITRRLAALLHEA